MRNPFAFFTNFAKDMAKEFAQHRALRDWQRAGEELTRHVAERGMYVAGEDAKERARLRQLVNDKWAALTDEHRVAIVAR